jgi:hypothetical protein
MASCGGSVGSVTVASLGARACSRAGMSSGGLSEAFGFGVAYRCELIADCPHVVEQAAAFSPDRLGVTRKLASTRLGGLQHLVCLAPGMPNRLVCRVLGRLAHLLRLAGGRLPELGQLLRRRLAQFGRLALGGLTERLGVASGVFPEMLGFELRRLPRLLRLVTRGVAELLRLALGELQPVICFRVIAALSRVGFTDPLSADSRSDLSADHGTSRARLRG